MTSPTHPRGALPYALRLRRLLPVLIALILPLGDASGLQGCLLDETVCLPLESCVSDGLFGQCFSEPDPTPPLLLDEELSLPQRALLRLELERLADEGLDWADSKAQCVLTYFKLSVAFDLSYDTEFCDVRAPANILGLLKRIESNLNEEQEEEEASLEQREKLAEYLARYQTAEDANEPVDLIPVKLVDEAAAEGEEEEEEEPALDQALLEAGLGQPDEEQRSVERALLVDEETGDAVPVLVVDEAVLEEAARQADQPVLVLDEADALQLLGAPEQNKSRALYDAALQRLLAVQDDEPEENPKDKRAEPEEVKLSEGEEKELKKYVDDILEGSKTDVKKLTTPQLEKLLGFVVQLEETLQNTKIEADAEPESNQELEEIVPLNSEHDGQQLLLKKDIEKFVDEDMGLEGVEHKIVKGDMQKVLGNRVYLKVNLENKTEDALEKLIQYLDKQIAAPNHLYFDDIVYEGGHLSFRIERAEPEEAEPEAAAPKGSAQKRVESASGVAQAVYKRRKDIQILSGLQVDETGIGAGQNTIPVERSGRDWLFMPILMVCSFTITSLVTVLAVHLIRNRRRAHSFKHLPEVVDCIDGKGTYEELCRQRMSSQDPIGHTVGKSGSTSSWPDEAMLQSCNLDISTGHVILNFLQEHLATPEKIEEQWRSVKDYRNLAGETELGQRAENRAKNLVQRVLPYDENVVLIQSEAGQEAYVNASKIHDSDPRQVAYIAAQAPLANTVQDFWQSIWEQGITLLVNLCDQQDQRLYQRYWPAEGVQTYGIYEVHLVSEHIWSEDYMVRSFYLKNTVSNETRTVTQFHYLAWPADGTPASIKSLLEFRRKVNKSYRGRQSAVLVHCTTGTNRTGTYCLMDMCMNRITKGIKELNIAGALEHLRDQRAGMVGTCDQYKLVFACVAEEVSALLKNLQQQ